MAPQRPAVTRESLGAWLIKAAPGALPIAEHLGTGFRALTTRCVRRSYRADLVESGQPVLLWVSGADRTFPAGIYASGRTTGRVGPGEDDAGLVMPVDLRAVVPPVRRAEVLAHPTLSQIEVVRMPAGSNPSYLDRAQLQALHEEWPHVVAS